MSKKEKMKVDLSKIISNDNEVANINFKNTTSSVKIDDNAQIKVKSLFFGELIYQNGRTKEITKWGKAGETQLMSMSDLRAMKAEQIAFFKNQWVIILGVADGSDCSATPADICKSLIITKYYENFVEPTNYDVICSWNLSDIPEKISLMSDGSKENLVVALNGYIESGALDSMKKIRAFEDALGCELLAAE